LNFIHLRLSSDVLLYADPSRRAEDGGKVNNYIQKKLDSTAEAAVILEGTVGFLDAPISVFVRLAKPAVLGDMPEVDIPTRFIYLLATPTPTGNFD
jgi:hypothetical protein